MGKAVSKSKTDDNSLNHEQSSESQPKSKKSKQKKSKRIFLILPSSKRKREKIVSLRRRSRNCMNITGK